jgi:hypothetical protein
MHELRKLALITPPSFLLSTGTEVPLLQGEENVTTIELLELFADGLSVTYINAETGTTEQANSFLAGYDSIAAFTEEVKSLYRVSSRARHKSE